MLVSAMLVGSCMHCLCCEDAVTSASHDVHCSPPCICCASLRRQQDCSSGGKYCREMLMEWGSPHIGPSLWQPGRLSPPRGAGGRSAPGSAAGPSSTHQLPMRTLLSPCMAAPHSKLPATYCQSLLLMRRAKSRREHCETALYYAQCLKPTFPGLHGLGT